MSETIKVDIWSDIACPWCYIGKHRFEAAVRAFSEQHPDVVIDVEGHSFELAPDTPESFAGSEIDFLVQHKGMPAAQVEQMLTQMTELFRSEGITVDFTRVRHTNTARVHRVLHLAKARGLQLALQEQLFRAYFTDGLDLGDVDVVAGLAAAAGLNADEARAAFTDESYAEAVAADKTRASMLGISGVPFFLLDQKYGISGAQSAEAFTGALEQVLELSRGEHAE